MSTWLYIECTDHNPPLRSTGEVGQHLEDLPCIRAAIADVPGLIAAQLGPVDDPGTWQIIESVLKSRHGWSWAPFFAEHLTQFMRSHYECNLRIVDEYGQFHLLQVDETDTDPGSGPVVRVDRYGFRWTLQDDGLWVSDVGTVRSDPHF